MADELLDLGAIKPGARRVREPEPPMLRREPTPVPAAAPAPAVIVPPPPPKRDAFAGDLPAGEDALGIDRLVAPLAELALHRGTVVPLCVGLLGAPGSGKSFALARLARGVRELSEAASAAPTGPFLDKTHVQAIDAATLEGDAGLALAGRLHAGLRRGFPALARELAQIARDPHVVLRETSERLDEARKRLDSERRALDDAGSRRARLLETVLYEAAGSQVDAYARANRAGIESRLVGFGIGGDPIRNYKDLVQLVAGSGGRVGLALRALWAFKGQTKLIVTAIVLVALGVGLGAAIDDQARWLGDLRTAGPQAAGNVANWFQAHMGLLATARTAAFALAGVAVAANLVRAFAFLAPIFKGARLLGHDLTTRKRDLDGLYAHQTKRVDALEADVERLSREVAEAERRAGGPGLGGERIAFEGGAGPATQAQDFFAALGSLMTDGAQQIPAPRRIVLALDHLDALAPERARAILDAVSRLTGIGLVTLAAVDTARLDPEGARRHELERWIQVPVRVDAEAGLRDPRHLVARLLGRDGPQAATSRPDPRHSVLDTAIGEEEATLVAALAPLAGPSPRGIKRFVNLYTLARLDADVRKGPLALMLALAQGGTATERSAVAEAVSSGGAFDLPQASARLTAALEAARTIDGRFTAADAAAALRRAATFSVGI